mmetsp:Transcript_168091/g.534800  ORF Transcript_168091/g.534800 Transcript_168091/m.534800 type:complete len:323 (+) Transcript_168091:222-1190(+)
MAGLGGVAVARRPLLDDFAHSGQTLPSSAGWLPPLFAVCALLPSGRGSSRRRRRAAGRAGRCVGMRADGEEAPPVRRRRRIAPPPAPAAAPPTAVETEEEEEEDDAAPAPRKVSCDCDLIYNTIVEIEDLLTPEQCDYLIKRARLRAARIGWGAETHGNYSTEDVKVWKLGDEEALRIFNDEIAETMMNGIAMHFGLPRNVVCVEDAFIVRYTMGAQTSLAFHRDGSIVSGIVSLSEPNEYQGGGTKFKNGKIFRPPKGSAILFGGQREHSGVEVTGGTRYICTLFFKCGGYSCRDYAESKDAEQDKDNLIGEVKNMFGFGG